MCVVARIKELAHDLVIDMDEEDVSTQETSATLTNTTTTKSQDAQKNVDESGTGALGSQSVGGETSSLIPDGVPRSELTSEKNQIVFEADVPLVENDLPCGTNGSATHKITDADVKNGESTVSDFQSVENRRGKGSRAHRGRGDGNFRGRGRAGFRGEKGDHRGRGSFRGRRGDASRPGKGNQQPQTQAACITTVN